MTTKFTSQRKTAGFTLAEMLVVLFMVSLLSILTLNVTGPWLAFKAQNETQQRLHSIRAAIEAYYQTHSYAISQTAAGNFGPFKTSTVTNERCDTQDAAFQALGPLLDEGAGRVAMDAYKSPFCVFVASGSKTVDGVTLSYRSIAFVSPGQDGRIGVTTALDPVTHQLTLEGDDQGFVYNGYSDDYKKLQLTQERMDRMAKMYEIFFTNRYLSNSARDLSTYYFGGYHDATTRTDCLAPTIVETNPVVSTRGVWGNSATILGPIGVGGDLTKSAWDDDTVNNIQVGNCTEADASAGMTVRSPATVGSGTLPYTALLRARLPSPAGSPVYAYRVVVGGY